jgi:hypothetical protein
MRIEPWSFCALSTGGQLDMDALASVIEAAA